MKKSYVKSTCKVVVGRGEALDASTTAKENAAWLSIFRDYDKKGYYVDSNGEWAPYSEMRISKKLQEQYLKAKKGDADAAKAIVARSGIWEMISVRNPRI